MSERSLSKRGYVQVELRRFLSEVERRPMGATYILPVRLEEVELPGALRHLHHIDLFPERQVAAERIAASLWEHWSARQSK